MIDRNRWFNLACRKSHDTIVTLDFKRDDFGEDTIRVIVNSPTSDFVLYPPNDRALDAYHHPFVYLNRVLQRGTYRERDIGHVGVPLIEETI